MAQKLEMRMCKQMGDVIFRGGVEIVDAHDVIAAVEQSLAQM